MELMNYFNFILYALAYLLVALALKAVLNWRAREVYALDDEIASGNIAVALRRSGAQLGLAFAMIGVLSGSGHGSLAQDLLATVAYGALGIVFMLVSLMVTDKLILPGVNNTEQLKGGNLAVGTLEFGTLLMTGILAYASIRGDDGGAVSSAIYFVAGQLSLIVLVLAYEKLASSKKLISRIENGELSAGIYLAGKVIAYGLILQSAIVGAGANGFMANAMEYVFAAVVGMVILYVFEILVDKLVVTASSVTNIIENNQIAAAVQLAIAKICMALILGMSIL